MAQAVPSLAAFREALLDALAEDKDAFRVNGAKVPEDAMFLQPALLVALEKLGKGGDSQKLLADLMESDTPRISKALAFARGVDPEVVSPDTVTLDSETQWDATLAGSGVSSGVSSGGTEGGLSGADASPSAASAAEPAPAGSRRRRGRRSEEALPLTIDLAADAADDLPLVGRDALIDQVARILLRFHEPAVLIVGDPGTGKTAFLRGVARAAGTGALPALAGIRFHQLRILDLVSQSHRGADIHELMDQLCERVAAEPSIVLVVDDLQTLVAKQGYPMITDVIDTLKLHIKRGKMRALLAVDGRAWEKGFSNDPFFSSELAVRRLPQLPREDLLSVERNVRGRLEKHFSLSIADDAVETAVGLALQEASPDYHPPGSAIRLLDEACAAARAGGEKTVTSRHVSQAATEDAPASVASWDSSRLARLQEALSSKVLGQELAAEAVARRVRLSKLHLDRKPNRPDGVFLFIGPSGVGKTEMARSLARALYDDESRLVRLDMSEYMEPHSIARIIGAPPGYVGYGEEGALTGPIARIGHGVVLLDEIEKAHPQVLNLFLQVFDDGRLTDSKGRVVDFSDTVIIMTSNIGRELYAIHGNRPIGFGVGEAPEPSPLRDKVQEYLLRVLPSEFVNRIDEIVPFRVLEPDDIKRIAQRLLDLEVERWKQRGKTLTWTPDVAAILATADYDPRLGARHLERNIERLVIAQISDAAVSPGFDAVRTMRLNASHGKVCLELDGKLFQCLPHGEPASGARRAAKPAAPGAAESAGGSGGAGGASARAAPRASRRPSGPDGDAPPPRRA